MKSRVLETLTGGFFYDYDISLIGYLIIKKVQLAHKTKVYGKLMCKISIFPYRPIGRIAATQYKVIFRMINIFADI